MTVTLAKPLISAAALQQLLQAREPAGAACCVVDCRHDLLQPEAGAAAFLAGHIPGALHAHLDRDLSGPKTGHNGRHPLPGRAALLATLRGWGIGDHTEVIAYDAHGGSYAARLWWLLRWLGHDAVRVLDGGLPAWQAAGFPIETGPAAPRKAAQMSERPPLVRAVDATAVDHLRRDPDACLFDARAPERFSGAQEPIDPVAGHVDGAVNRPWTNNLRDGRLKPAAELRGEFDQLRGARPATALVAMCGSGVTACHNLLALEVAGLPGAALYPGSWSEWCSDPARAVASGT